MAGEPIDLFGVLRQHQPSYKRQKYRARMTVEFRAPSIFFDGDERKVAQPVAEAIARAWLENFAAGKGPTGEPLPAAAATTVERRAYRLKQAAAGGSIHVRYDRRTKFARRAKINWNRRFRASKLGTHLPNQQVGGGRLFGAESGLLFRSVKVVPGSDGAWRLFFAANRAIIDDTGQSAVTRVFKPQGKISIWSVEAMRQPSIQDALHRVARGMTPARIIRLARTLMGLGGDIESLIGQVQETGEAAQGG